MNIPGSFYCDCNNRPNEEADPETGQCSCMNGYTENDSGFCEDIDECNDFLGDCEQICINTEGSYTCECDWGFELNDDNTSCNDVNECETRIINGTIVENGGCQAPGKCINFYGAFVCECPSGYEADWYEGLSCVDVDECEMPYTCHQGCENYDGGYQCTCDSGFELSGNGRWCKPLPESRFERFFRLMKKRRNKAKRRRTDKNRTRSSNSQGRKRNEVVPKQSDTVP